MGARVQFDKADVGLAELAARYPARVDYAIAHAKTQFGLARIDIGQGDLAAAMKRSGQARARIEPLLATHGDDSALVRAVIDGYEQVTKLETRLAKAR